MGLYIPAILSVNLILLVSATALLYLANLLVNFYLLPILDFVSVNFSAVPHLMLGVGVLAFLSGLLGLIAGSLPRRPLLVSHAVLLSVVFIVQLASIYTTSQLRSGLEHHILNQMTYDLYEVTSSYWTDTATKQRWDQLQRTYSCCGLLSLNTGYKDWQVGKKPQGVGGGWVPDSCCLQETPGCGRDAAIRIDPHHQIFTHGCLAILEVRMARDIEPVLLAYLASAVVLAIIQILAIVLSSAYCAVLSRRKKKLDDDPVMSSLLGAKSLHSRHLDFYSLTGNMPAEAADSGVPSTLNGSRKSGLHREEDDNVSSASSRHAGSNYRSSLHLEPLQEVGTAI